VFALWMKASPQRQYAFRRRVFRRVYGGEAMDLPIPRTHFHELACDPPPIFIVRPLEGQNKSRTKNFK
jgi:hypothetical protein